MYEPTKVPGLALSVDYYDIDLSETIGSLGTQRIVDDCFAGITEECALVERDPATNIITRVSNILVNIDDAKAAGTDLELTYARGDSFNFASWAMRSRALKRAELSWCLSDHLPLWVEFMLPG